ncbi:unnamed protein product [Nezara viridula]|uniref:Neuropeptide n=1 Tax=Nezara viridula TaxID=85310 RepID=A0A9P0H8N1_NEZVI|nr:unnamed protein product [Nezara viridula]
MWPMLVVLASAAVSAAVFTNQFAVRIPSGDPASLAAKHGFLYLGQDFLIELRYHKPGSTLTDPTVRP